MAVIGLSTVQLDRSGIRNDHDVVITPSWSRVAARFASVNPPDVLAVGTPAITAQAPNTVNRLAGLGIRRSIVILLTDTKPDTIRLAWSLNIPDAYLAFDCHELGSAVRTHSSIRGVAPVLEYVARRLDLSNGPAAGILAAVADSVRAGENSVSDVIRRVRQKRSATYAILTATGCPPLEQLLVLARLTSSLESMENGSSTADAAFVAGYSSVKAWRRALRDRLGITIPEIRGRSADWRWIVDRWLERHASPHGSPVSGAEPSCSRDERPPHRTFDPPDRTVKGRPRRRQPA